MLIMHFDVINANIVMNRYIYVCVCILCAWNPDKYEYYSSNSVSSTVLYRRTTSISPLALIPRFACMQTFQVPFQKKGVRAQRITFFGRVYGEKRVWMRNLIGTRPVRSDTPSAAAPRPAALNAGRRTSTRIVQVQ